jgi:hypothetical protein
MSEEADDDILAEDGARSALSTAALRAIKDGDLLRARDMLQAGQRGADESAAILYHKLLEQLNDHAAMQVTVAEMVRTLPARQDPSEDYLAFVLRHAEAECLPAAMIEEALDFVGRLKLPDGELDRAYRAMRRRQRFRVQRAPRAARVTLVSLGTRCLPWALPNRWGLRSADKFLYAYTPFSQAVHSMGGIVDAIRGDFATYMAPDEIGVQKSARGHQVVYRKDRGAVWNHFRNSYWLEDDHRELRRAQQHAIENFRRCCRDEMPVFVLGHITAEYPDEKIPMLQELQDALRVATGRAQNHLLITNQRSTDVVAGRPSVIDSHTMFASVPYPKTERRNYDYARSSNFNSSEGFDFERRYVKVIFGCLRRWGLLEAAQDAAKP